MLVLNGNQLAEGGRIDSTGRNRARKRLMPNRAIAAVTKILRPEIDLGKSRLETLCLIVIDMVRARSVNLSHIACERPGASRRHRPVAGCNASLGMSVWVRIGRCR